MRHTLRASGLIGAIMAVMLVVAACGGGDDEAAQPTSPPAPAATPTRAATPTPVPAPTATPEPRPVRGGIFKVRLLQDVIRGRGWDGHLASGHVPIRVLPGMFNNVLMTNVIDHVKIEGDAAESWSVSADGLTYTFKLRPGITWHDGKPLTSKDVAYSFNRIAGKVDPAFRSHVRELIAPYVDTIETPDPLTINVKLKAPSLAFLNGVAVLFVQVYPEHLGHLYPQEPANPPVGSGPFVFKSREANIRIEVRKNPNYFKKDKFGDSLPYFDGIDYEVIPDGALALSAFRTGRFLETDYLDSEALNTNIDAVKREFPTFNFKSGYGSWSLIAFNNKAPFSDVRIRRALELLIDRDGFNAARYPGIGSPVAGVMQPASFGGQYGLTDQEIGSLINVGPRTQQHIDRAKALFAEAGVKYEGFTFELMSLGLSQFDNDALFIKEGWDRAGLVVNFNNKGGSAQFNDRRFKADYDTYLLPSSAFFDDPNDVIGRWYVTGAAFNSSKFSDAKLDGLYAQQAKELDFAKRKQITAELQKHILTDANWYPKLNWRGGWVAWSPQIRNYNAQAPGAYAFRSRHEITWIAP